MQPNRLGTLDSLMPDSLSSHEYDGFVNSINAQYSDKFVVSQEYCTICRSSDLEILITLPDFPLTGLYTRNRPTEPHVGIDQQVSMCQQCGHVQLVYHVSSDLLYRESYNFRTSQTSSARGGVQYFIETIQESLGKGDYQSILDVGCNDLFLLQQLEGMAKRRTGIDPIWLAQENNSPADIDVLGSYIEDIDSDTLTEISADLIICRHVLEHVSEPRVVLQRLVECAAPKATFVLEVPCLDALLYRYRFDQMFHQHLQYFSLHSLLRIIEEVGGCYLGHWINYEHWGSLVLAFRVGNDESNHVPRPFSTVWSREEIQKRYAIFKRQMQISGEVLDKGELPIYGYGASPMLPTLAYHLETDLINLIGVLDDDSAKHNLYYENLPLQVFSPRVIDDWSSISILVTAPESSRHIIRNCYKRNAAQVLHPLPLLS